MRMKPGVVGGLLALTLLSACGEDEKPRGLPSLSATPSASTASGTPSEAPSDEPTETPEQAIRRVALSWYPAVARAYQTGDHSELVELSDAVCVGCLGQIKAVKSLRSKQRRVEGGEFTVRQREVAMLAKGEGYVEVDVSYPGANVVDADGTSVDRVPSANVRQRITVARVSGRWIVTDVMRMS